ncbi:IscS subfamily cysteine desulfurase [Alkalihalobacterium bogoriense]|uniref:IscS subfamily cysteine desulfurase n=1 Tax=Alkalihalobacterium bogoriense TaxID=246272 RepID=UPI00047DF1BF|nr:IscS subfamily cysteine desulfurase [Alkalihalobacterium bogoriense]
MIYLDYSATTPMSEHALQVYTKVAKDYFGNANSLHDYGETSNQLVTSSRSEIASLINGEPRGIYFTSGGSESNYLSLLSLISHAKEGKNHLITTQIEHPSVLNTFQLLEKQGFSISYVPVNEYGQVHLSDLKKLVNEKTILVSIGHANAELGTIQNIVEIGNFLFEKNILFHSDCVQSFGKINIDVKQAKLTCITMSAHKIYGPKGVGSVYIDPSLHWKPVVPNGTHESGFRQGTLNVPGIAAFAVATRDRKRIMGEEARRLKELQQKFLAEMNSKNIILEGHPTLRLPHHLALRIKGIEGQYVMLECNRRGIAISTGSACKVGETAPANSMVATGKSQEEAYEFIRLTMGQSTTEAEIVKTVAALHDIIQQFYS